MKYFFASNSPIFWIRLADTRRRRTQTIVKRFALYENAERRRRKTAQATAKGYEFQAKAKTLI